MTDYVVKPLDASSWDAHSRDSSSGTTVCSVAVGARGFHTRSLHERAGFSYLRPNGKTNCVTRIVVP